MHPRFISYSLFLLVMYVLFSSGVSGAHGSTAPPDSCVYPGDMNADGIVDIREYLNYGIAFMRPGPSRSDTSTGWYCHTAQNWSWWFADSLNYKHTDSNGDGYIFLGDYPAIGENWSHDTTASYRNDGTSSDPPFYMEYDKSAVNLGDSLTLGFYLGTTQHPVWKAYGFVFTLTGFDATLFDYWRVLFDWNTLNNNFGSYAIVHADTDTAGRPTQVSFAFSRVDHTNNYVSGDLGVYLQFFIKDSIFGFSSPALFMPHIKNFRLIEFDETEIPLYVSEDSAMVYDGDAGIAGNSSRWRNEVKIYPNPFSGTLKTVLPENIGEKSFRLCVFDLTGRKLRDEEMRSETHTTDVSDLPAGLYLVKLSGEGWGEVRKMVKY